MSLRTVLIAAICIGLQSSLCTGGLFSVTVAAANQLAFSSTDSGPMSYGSIGYLSCKTSQRTGDVMSDLDVGGCKNAETCFTQAQSFIEDRSTAHFFITAIENLVVQDAISTSYTVQPSFILARAGPLYEDALSHMRSQRKIE